MIFKFSLLLKRALFPLLLVALGIIFLISSYDPGRISNIFAWLETDGNIVSLIIGSALIVFATVFFILALNPISPAFRIVHGKLTCLIEQKVIQALVKQILAEYFQNKELEAEVGLSRGTLFLKIEVPSNTLDLDKFTEYLRDRLFLLAGYYGDIVLSSSVKKNIQINH